MGPSLKRPDPPTWQVLRGKGLATHGLQQLETLLDPLPSLEHAGVPFRVWVEFRAQLLTK